MSQKVLKKRFKWSSDLEDVLICLWEENINNLRKQKRNGHVYAQMADQFNSMLENRVKIDLNEIHNKINNLTQRYRYVCINVTKLWNKF